MEASAVLAGGDGGGGEHERDEEGQGPGGCQNTVQQKGNDGELQAGPENGEVGLPGEFDSGGCE